MPHVDSLCADNIALLKAGLSLLEGMDSRRYNEVPTTIFTAPVGAHFRHIIDHFDNLFAQLETRELDYDARAREKRVEVDRQYAAGRLRHIIDRLARLAASPDRTALSLRAVTRPGVQPMTAQTSLARELLFLHNHTTHHYALVALLLRAAGEDIDPDFGLAPSSPRHEDVRRCAP